MASTYYTGLSQIKAAIEALALPLPVVGGSPATLIRMLPRINDELDKLPSILVVPDEKPEKLRRRSFEGDTDCSYLCEVVIVAATEADYLSNLDLYLGWREAIRLRFLNPDTFASFRMSMVDPGRPLDRSKVREDYYYSAQTVRLIVLEQPPPVAARRGVGMTGGVLAAGQVAPVMMGGSEDAG